MKIFILLFFMISHVFGAGGCFRDPSVNEAVADEASMPCENLPEFPDVDDLDIDVEKDITFYEEDFRRLPKLNELTFSEYSLTYVLKLKGTISLPKLEEIQIKEGIHRIDTSEGKFVFGALEDIETVYFDDLIRILKSGQIAEDGSIDILAPKDDEVHLDFSGVDLGQHLELTGFRAVRNLQSKNIKGLWIHGSEKFPTVLSQVNITVESSMELEHVRLENFVPFRLLNCYRFSLINVSVDSPIVTPDSKISWLNLVNSSIVLPGDEVLRHTSSFSLKNSRMNGAIIRVDGKEVSSMTLENSEVTLDRLPYAPRTNEVIVSGKVTILDPSKPLEIGEYNSTVLLSSLRLPVLNIVLRNPKNLTNLILIDDVAENFHFENTEYLGLVPKNLKILVDKKSTALEWRKLFKTKAVGFTEATK